MLLTGCSLPLDAVRQGVNITSWSCRAEGAQTPAVTARGDILEKPPVRRKANWRLFEQPKPARQHCAQRKSAPHGADYLKASG